MGLKDDIAKLITVASAAINKPMVDGIDFYMVHQPINHKPLALPSGKIAVYTFYYNGFALGKHAATIVKNYMLINK